MKKDHIYEKHVFVCTSGKTCPHKGDVEGFVTMMRDEVKNRGLKDKIRINKAGCLNWCDVAPVMVIYPETSWHTELTEESVKEILETKILND